MNETTRLIRAVNEFSCEMMGKLLAKMRQGYSGWDSPTYEAQIELKLVDHYKKFMAGDNNQAVDVANLIMMLYRIRKAKKLEGGK
jgi:hypothetical protein